MKRSFTIAVLPGDGIGPEIVPVAVKVLEATGRLHGLAFTFKEVPVGGMAIDQTGTPLPEETLSLAKQSDAVLLGAVGGPKWDHLESAQRPERALLGLRGELGLFANLRPAKIFPDLIEASPLRSEVVRGTDILVVRELTGGLYFGTPKGIKPYRGGERGINTLVYTTKEIQRIAKVGFETARKRKGRVTSVDKANVLESSALWRKVVMEVHKDFSDIELNHMYVDNCAMQLIRDPRQFDVIVTTNMFGDILSDEAAMLTGSIGMLPSASMGTRSFGLYEPIHGAAPDIAGKDVANPIGTVLSAAMMLRYSLKQDKAAEDIEETVQKILSQNYRTLDIMSSGMKSVGTQEMGNLIVKQLLEV